MRIVKYSNFINEAVNHDALAQSVEDCLVELSDSSFEVKVAKVRNNFSGICLFITVKKSNDGKFKMKDLKESFDVMIDLLDEGFTYDVLTKFRLVFSSPNYDIESFGGYSGFKANLIEEIDNVLVELTDDNFWFSRELNEKDDNYILELCIEKEIPEGQLPGQIHDWYEETFRFFQAMFFIRDVYEPLSLLVEWMQEKYSAELVEYNRGGLGTGIFKTETDEDYLESRVSSVRLKFIWKK